MRIDPTKASIQNIRKTWDDLSAVMFILRLKCRREIQLNLRWSVGALMHSLVRHEISVGKSQAELLYVLRNFRKSMENCHNLEEKSTKTSQEKNVDSRSNGEILIISSRFCSNLEDLAKVKENWYDFLFFFSLE